MSKNKVSVLPFQPKILAFQNEKFKSQNLILECQCLLFFGISILFAMTKRGSWTKYGWANFLFRGQVSLDFQGKVIFFGWDMKSLFIG